MNKTTRISIGKTPYDIEVGAEESLREYLAALGRALEDDSSSETMSDIELHITEVLAGLKVKPGGVITASDVVAIKEQLGEPEQFGDTSEPEAKVPKPKRSKSFLVVMTVVLILLAGTFGALRWNGLWPFSTMTATETQTYDNKITSLESAIESGNFEVRPSTDGKVTVERQLKWARSKPTYTEKWTGDQLRITADCPDNAGSCSIDYVVYVPSSVTVHAESQSGNIRATGVEGDVNLGTESGNIETTDTKGSLKARTSSGNITASRVSSKDVDAQVDSGNVDLRFTATPNKVVARSSSGNIDIAVPAQEKYVVRAETDSGRREVSAPQDSTSARTIDAETNSGNVTVRGF
jgi:hypothetical protein